MGTHQTLGEYLSALREDRDLSLEDVEEQSGNRVSRAYLSLLERGSRRDPSPQILKALAEVYDVEFSALLRAHQADLIHEPVREEIPPVDGEQALRRIYRVLNEEARADLLKHARMLRDLESRRRALSQGPTTSAGRRFDPRRSPR